MYTAWDVETTGLDPWSDRLLGLSVANDAKAEWIPFSGKGLLPLQAIAAQKSFFKVGHNLRFDRKFMQVNGIDLNGPYEDTILLAQVIDENQELSLKKLSVKYFGDDATKWDRVLATHLKALKLTKKDLGDSRVDQRIVAEYCKEDTVNTLRLFHALKEKVSEKQWQYYKEEMLPCEDVLMHMELQGVKIDTAKLAEAETLLSAKITEVLLQLESRTTDERRAVCATLKEGESFNWNSGPQRIKLFYGQLGLDRFFNRKTKKGNRSLNGKDLKALDLPVGKLKEVIDCYMEYQVYQKLHSTYVVGIRERLKGDRIHAEFYQTAKETYGSSDEGGTVTGRLSHRNPNLANLPSRSKDYWRGPFVKDLFIPDTGAHTFLYGDYSQIELRVAAHLSQDPSMCLAFREGRDLHQETADYLRSTGVEVTRSQAKTINFAIIYGAGGYRLAQILGWQTTRENIDRGEAISKNLLEGRFKTLGHWIQGNINRLRQCEYVESMFGRRRTLPEACSSDPKISGHAIKQGCNFIVQSAAASICKRAMIALHAEGFDLRDQIHDAIICHARRDKVALLLPKMKSIMENIIQLSVPLICEPKICETFLVD